MKKLLCFLMLIILGIPGFSQNWISQSTGFTTPSRGIQDMDAVDYNILWAVAYDGSGSSSNCQDFTRTTNGGATWTPGTIPGISNLSLAMVDALDAQTAWVVAYPPGSSTTNQGIYKTVNGGTTWVRQTTAAFTNSLSFVNCVHFYNANEGWCMGDPINGDFEIYTTTNGGTTWTLVPGSQIANPVSGEFGVVGYTCSAGDTSWFGTNKGRIYRSTDKGHNWTVSSIPGWSSIYVCPVFKDGMHGLAQNRGQNSNGALAETSNGGVTWTVINGTGNVFYNDLKYVPGTPNTYAADGADAVNSMAGFMTSYDGGHTWTIMPETDGVQYLAGAWVDPQHGWAGSFNTDAYTDGMYKFTGNLSGTNFITVLTPNGGEYLQTGTSYNITWNCQGVTNVKIEYSINNGSTWNTIVTSYPASTGSYPWSVPASASTQCKVRVSDSGNPTLSDVSDNVFTISSVSQSVTVVSPNGGETWVCGNTYNITWTSSGVSYVNIEYSTDYGFFYTPIASNYPASAGVYSFTVPYVPCDQSYVKISDASNSSLYDISDNYFAIVSGPSLQVLSPNGGENCVAGNYFNITWSGSGINYVKLEYTTNNGSTWSTIISSYPANAGMYNWLVPNTPSAQCRVRVSDAGNPGFFDTSDGLFTITSSLQSVTVTNPNGGETWLEGSSQFITWAAQGINDVKIEYTIDNGVNWSTIIYSYPAYLGSYSWFIPNTPSGNCRVRISSSTNSSVLDISDNVFTISTSGQSTPDICIVTVDSTNNKNMIVWEKTFTTGINHYNIYVEGAQANVYELIGAVPYNNLSVFTDLNSNPLQQANKYKISAVDNYNIETDLSDAHMTVHLTINQGAGNTFNLMWNDYEGFFYPSVNLYRGTSPSNMSLLATVSSSLNSFTDLYPPSGYVYYKLEVLKPVPCSPSKTPIASSVSNIASNDPYLSAEDHPALNQAMIVYPNPSDGKIKICSNSDIEVSVFNSMGAQIKLVKIHAGTTDLDLSQYGRGVYYLQTNNQNKPEFHKLIIL